MQFSPTSNLKENKLLDRYRDKASMLMEKLNQLQKNSEKTKSQQHSKMLEIFDKGEKKILAQSKFKEGVYDKIIKMTEEIQKEVMDQANQCQRWNNKVTAEIDSSQKELMRLFESMEKEQKKSEAVLQKYIQVKLQGVISKNQNLLNQKSLIDCSLYEEEVDYLLKDHKRFLDNILKQNQKLKKQTQKSLKSLKTMVETEIYFNEQPIISFMKTVHMDVNSRLLRLKQQREATEQKVLSILERVVKSCIEDTEKLRALR